MLLCQPRINRYSQINRRITIANSAEVALEVTNINGVEANLMMGRHVKLAQITIRETSTDDGDPESDVSFSKPVPNEVIFTLKELFNLI